MSTTAQLATPTSDHSHSNPQQREYLYVCPKCHRQFRSLSTIERHFKNKLPCDYVCGGCNKPQHSKRSYYRHIKACPPPSH